MAEAAHRVRRGQADPGGRAKAESRQPAWPGLCSGTRDAGVTGLGVVRAWPRSRQVSKHHVRKYGLTHTR